MRIAALVVVVALAVAAIVVPEPAQPVPLPPSPQSTAPYTVCPLGEAARRSTSFTFVDAAAESTVRSLICDTGDAMWTMSTCSLASNSS